TTSTTKTAVTPRPALPADADSSDPSALLAFADRQLATDAEQARRAYYWAARYDPTSADAVMGQWNAVMLASEKARIAFLEQKRDPAAQAVDSLRQLATLRDPFVASPQMLEIVRREVRDRNPHITESELLAAFDNMMAASPNPFIAAMVAEQSGRLLQALAAWGRAAERAKGDWTLRLNRARIFRALGTRDSAIAELQRAIKDRPGSDQQAKGRTVVLFVPLAMLYHALGILHTEGGADSLARGAFEQAIAEDASFWPAQVRLAVLARQRGDTAAAIAGLQLAVQTSPDEVLPQFELAVAQVMSGDAAAALRSLKRVEAMEPWFALPYLLQARLYEQAEYTDEAVAAYAAFVARAPKGPERDAAEAKRKALAKPTP
ncbi:MAG: hypothetical protein MUF53_00850, partial [Gemmatimonadaceae bacterium]|nr:hypothetical protein [Gemmatimonadaceae bacterium]